MRRHSAFVSILVFSYLGLSAARSAEPFRYAAGKHGKGELKYINGLPVLLVEGTPAEMGEQIGKLTSEPLSRLMKFAPQFIKASGHEAAWPALVKLSKSMLDQFPADHRKELEAIARASKLDFDLGVAGNCFPDIKKIGGCASLIVAAERSASGGPLFGRNLDYPTLGYLQDYSLVTIYRASGKHAFVSIGFPGLIGCVSGMNDAGLALATLEVYSSRDGSTSFDPKGTPYALCYRRILEECTTVAEAETLLRSLKRTTYNNLAVCDRKGGAVFEITPRSVVVRRPEQNICCCTNHFCTEELRTTTRCWRFPILEKSKDLKQVTLADVARTMHAVNQGGLTLQMMVFEPAAQRLHLAIGKCPASQLPLKALDLKPLFGKKPPRKEP